MGSPSLVFMSHIVSTIKVPPHIFLNETTIPVVIDDITAKAPDTWEELSIEAYNGTSCGTQSCGVKSFSTFPVVSFNWKLGAEPPRAYSQAVHIGFNEHTEEPEANLLFAKMQQSRDTASASVGEVLCQMFMLQETKEHINNVICPAVSRMLATFTTQTRFTTTVHLHVLPRGRYISSLADRQNNPFFPCYLSLQHFLGATIQ